MTDTTNLEDTQPLARLCFIVIVPNYWGKGKTIEQAWENVSDECGKSKAELKRAGYYAVVVMPETATFKAYVDELGRMHWTDVQGIEAVTIEQRGLGPTV